MTTPKETINDLSPEMIEKLKTHANQLLEYIEDGDHTKALGTINSLSDFRDQCLYTEVGQLTRFLHESIRDFKIDTHKPEQEEALSKISDASDRLEYVVQQTSESANTTLDLAEDAIPRADSLKEESEKLRDEWHAFRDRKYSKEGFPELYQRIDAFFEKTASEAEQLSSGLHNILMAQGFQDITGQALQKVMSLVTSVEDHLVKLVVMASRVDQITGTVHEFENDEDKHEQGAGPMMNSETREDVVSGQDDVDDLLSSLGF